MLSSRFFKNYSNIKNVLEIQNYLENDIEKSHLVETMELFYLPKDLYNEIQNVLILLEISMIMQVQNFIV